MKNSQIFAKGLSGLFVCVVASSCASLTPNAKSLNYGSVLVGNTATNNMTWTNTSKNTVNFLGFNPPGSPFAQTAPTPVTGGNIVSGGTTPTATYTFTPTATGTFTDTATPLLGGGDFSDPVTLTGTGVGHTITGQGFGIAGGNFRTTQVLDFGTIPVGQVSVLRFNLLNGSANPLSLTGVALKGGPFAVTAPAQPFVIPAAPGPLQPKTQEVRISFAPQVAGRFLDHIRLTDPARPGYVLIVVVTGAAE